MSAIRFRLIAPAVLLCIVAATSAASGQATGQAPVLRSPDVVFVPTPPEAVEAMLKLAKVGPNDVVYDLSFGIRRWPHPDRGRANVQGPIGDGDRHRSTTDQGGQ